MEDHSCETYDKEPEMVQVRGFGELYVPFILEDVGDLLILKELKICSIVRKDREKNARRDVQKWRSRSQRGLRYTMLISARCRSKEV